MKVNIKTEVDIKKIFNKIKAQNDLIYKIEQSLVNIK